MIPPLIARYLIESQIGYIQIQIQFGIDAAGRTATLAQGCAGWARNPKGPQITPFRHQMGRRGTIWDFKTGIRLRIPARISPWGSRAQIPTFSSRQFSGRVSNLSATHGNGFGAQGPTGARPKPPEGPKGPRGPSGAREKLPKGPMGRP